MDCENCILFVRRVTEKDFEFKIREFFLKSLSLLRKLLPPSQFFQCLYLTVEIFPPFNNFLEFLYFL